jgi:hypothetical protein
MSALYKQGEHVQGRLSPALWAKVPTELFAPHGDPGLGWYKCYDWIDETLYDSSTLEFTGWQLTANSGTAVLGAGNGGLLTMSATSSNGQGPQIQLGDVAWIDFDSCSRVTMEMYGTTTGVSTVGPEFFFGLSVEDTTIIASDANSATDHVGIQRLAADTATLLGGVSAVASGSVTGAATFTNTAASPTTANGAFQCGLQVTRDGARFCFNGTMEADALAGSEITRVAMLPSLVWQGNGTDTPVLNVDWIAIAVER